MKMEMSLSPRWARPFAAERGDARGTCATGRGRRLGVLELVLTLVARGDARGDTCGLTVLQVRPEVGWNSLPPPPAPPARAPARPVGARTEARAACRRGGVGEAGGRGGGGEGRRRGERWVLTAALGDDRGGASCVVEGGWRVRGGARGRLGRGREG